MKLKPCSWKNWAGKNVKMNFKGRSEKFKVEKSSFKIFYSHKEFHWKRKAYNNMNYTSQFAENLMYKETNTTDTGETDQGEYPIWITDRCRWKPILHLQEREQIYKPLLVTRKITIFRWKNSSSIPAIFQKNFRKHTYKAGRRPCCLHQSPQTTGFFQPWIRAHFHPDSRRLPCSHRHQA